jgi:hypothetical protein
MRERSDQSGQVGYTAGMDITLVVLAIVVALVAIDGIARLDERKPRRVREDQTAVTTQKIVVDLSGRDRD